MIIKLSEDGLQKGSWDTSLSTATRSGNILSFLFIIALFFMTKATHLVFCFFTQIFVHVHREIHWCLAIINKKDRKFQYLDSLKGRDFRVMEHLV